MQKNHIMLAIVTAMLAMTSCVKNELDDPPANGVDPDITANKTIAELKQLFVNNTVIKIDSDYVVAGIVVGDDFGGNFYKSIVIQDSTGGINIQLDQSNYYSIYERGRRVFIRCKGLVIGDYGDLIQLGGYIDNTTGTPSVGRIAQSLVPYFLVGGMWNQPYDTKVTNNINSLNDVTDQNKLVRLDSVHFDASAVCKTWGDVANQTSANHNLLDKFGNVIVVRTSNFAKFANELVPAGIGSVTGVFQIFGSTKQFVIRSLHDVSLPAPNCIVNNNPAHNIKELRDLYIGTTRTIPNGSSIEGVVISDKDNFNITGNNVVIQDATAGIVVRFTSPNTYTIGQKIQINVSNQELSEFNGLLQVNNVNPSLATATGTGTVTPNIATIADINANGEAWESTLVTIQNVSISGAGSTYSGNTTLTDATGTLAMFTRSAATFSGLNYPTGTLSSITGIVSDFNARQLNIRNTTDVVP